MCIKKQQLELDMEQVTRSKLGKEYFKSLYYHPIYLTYMQSISCEVLGEFQAVINIARRNKNNLRYADNVIQTTEREGELRSLLMRVKEESEKTGLKLNIQNTKFMVSGPIQFSSVQFSHSVVSDSATP